MQDFVSYYADSVEMRGIISRKVSRTVRLSLRQNDKDNKYETSESWTLFHTCCTPQDAMKPSKSGATTPQLHQTSNRRALQLLRLHLRQRHYRSSSCQTRKMRRDLSILDFQRRDCRFVWFPSLLPRPMFIHGMEMLLAPCFAPGPSKQTKRHRQLGSQPGSLNGR